VTQPDQDGPAPAIRGETGHGQELYEKLKPFQERGAGDFEKERDGSGG